MPNATVPTDAQHFELKSLEGAYVDLKPLPYGELLERRDKASRMSMEAGGGRKRQDTSRVDIDMMQAHTRLYEFQHCIVDHNLEDDKGNKLNFTNSATLNLLHPKVGQEIETLIDRLNELEDLDEETFTSVASSSTSGEQKQLSEPSLES
jgi:transcriptional/translational regulatory protein YebC/TACO1